MNPPASEHSWEHFEHGADVGIRGFGKSKAEAFANGAVAMTAAMLEPDVVRASKSIEISCTGSNDDMLFYAWLNELVYEMATRRMVFGRFEVTIEDGRLDGVAWGEPVDRIRHEPAVEIKGATFTMLEVAKDKSGRWHAQCVVDV